MIKIITLIILISIIIIILVYSIEPSRLLFINQNRLQLYG